MPRTLILGVLWRHSPDFFVNDILSLLLAFPIEKHCISAYIVTLHMQQVTNQQSRYEDRVWMRKQGSHQICSQKSRSETKLANAISKGNAWFVEKQQDKDNIFTFFRLINQTIRNKHSFSQILNILA